MIVLEAGGWIGGITPNDLSSINMVVEGMELTGTTEVYKTLAQATLTTSVLDVYDVPGGKTAFIKGIHLANKTASPVSGVRIQVSGSAAANRITGSFTIPANGWAVYEENGWRVYDSRGRIQ